MHLVLTVVVFFKFRHPIDFSKVISKAGASLKTVFRFSFFLFKLSLSSFTRPKPDTDFHIPPRKDHKNQARCRGRILAQSGPK